MPRYFFDIENGGSDEDDTGVECRNLAEVRAVAVRTLTSIAGDEAVRDDRMVATLVARDESGRPVLAVTLSLATLWLGEAAAQPR